MSENEIWDKHLVTQKWFYCFEGTIKELKVWEIKQFVFHKTVYKPENKFKTKFLHFETKDFMKECFC